MDGHRWSCRRVGTKTCLRHRPAFIGSSLPPPRLLLFSGKTLRHCNINPISLDQNGDFLLLNPNYYGCSQHGMTEGQIAARIGDRLVLPLEVEGFEWQLNSRRAPAFHLQLPSLGCSAALLCFLDHPSFPLNAPFSSFLFSSS